MRSTITKPGQTIAQRKLESQERFLNIFRKNGTIGGSCRLARITRWTHYDWLDTDPSYVRRFKDAFEDAVDRAEKELIRRGVDGWTEKVYYQGEVVDEKIVKSDQCLTFYLKGRRKEVFGADRVELTGANGGPITTAIMDRLTAGRKRVQQQRALPEMTPIDAEAETAE